MSFSIPGKILEEYTVRNNRLALVQFGDTCRPIFLDLVPDASVGDYVRIHVGFATEKVTEEEAWRAYQELGLEGHLSALELDIEEDEAQPAMVRRQKQR